MRQDVQVILIIAAVAVLLVVIGAFLPWIKLAAPLIGQISKSGMEDGSDGLYTLLMGLGAGALLAWYHFGTGQERQVFIGVGVLGALIAIVAGVDINDVNSRADELTQAQQRLATITVGDGLYLTLVGGIGLALTGAATFFFQKHR